MQRIYIPNKRIATLGSAHFIKVDATNQNRTLGGAVFRLYKLNAETGIYEVLLQNLVSQADGRLTINQLEQGRYMLEECNAPSGYMLENARVCFSIMTDASGNATSTDTILLLNRPVGKNCCYCFRCNCTCFCNCFCEKTCFRCCESLRVTQFFNKPQGFS